MHYLSVLCSLAHLGRSLKTMLNVACVLGLSICASTRAGCVRPRRAVPLSIDQGMPCGNQIRPLVFFCLVVLPIVRYNCSGILQLLLCASLAHPSSPHQSSFGGSKSLASNGRSAVCPNALFASASIWCLPAPCGRLSDEKTILTAFAIIMNITAMSRWISWTIHRSGKGSFPSSIRPSLWLRIRWVLLSGLIGADILTLRDLCEVADAAEIIRL